MFIPKRIIFEKNALNYEMGKNIYEKFKDKAEIITLTNNKIKGNIPGDNIMEYYKEGKNTLVVGVKKGYKFQSCKPSDHWQLPLLSGCVGNCQYCYLNTNLEDKPFIKINVNIDDYEKRTANREKRIEASVKMMKAGYPVGYIIAPVFMYEGWEEDYRQLLIYLSEKIPKDVSHPITFEVISHRYTTRAKNIINEVFPKNTLPMNDEERTYKYGQFGYGKFVYPKDSLAYMKEFFQMLRLNILFKFLYKEGV